jgi:16S rRNA (guanine527-N7)-methyltransferase
MDSGLIAELLERFLTASADVPITNVRSFEAGQRRGETQDLALSLPKGSAVLSAIQLQSISTYIDILLRWNARINLTAIRDPEEIVTRHFGESLFAARHLLPGYPVPPVPSVLKDFDRPSVADLGSGAGFPGLPIKLWAPDIALTLIESNQKKATFLREVTRALTLTDVNVYSGRAETLATQSTFDLVTLRAVERFADVLSIAASLVAPEGRLALLIGGSQRHQAQTALPNFSWHEPLHLPYSQSRILLIGRHS